LTNNDPVVTIRIDALIIDWNVATSITILDEFLGGLLPGNQIGISNETTSPSIFPVAPDLFTGGASRREISSGVTKTLYINFQVAPTVGGYTVIAHFNIGCRVSASK